MSQAINRAAIFVGFFLMISCGNNTETPDTADTETFDSETADLDYAVNCRRRISATANKKGKETLTTGIVKH